MYGFYRPTDVFGGELIRCLQEQDGRYVEVNKQPTVHLPAKLEPFLVTPSASKCCLVAGAVQRLVVSVAFWRPRQRTTAKNPVPAGDAERHRRFRARPAVSRDQGQAMV